MHQGPPRGELPDRADQPQSRAERGIATVQTSWDMADEHRSKWYAFSLDFASWESEIFSFFKVSSFFFSRKAREHLSGSMERGCVF